MATTHARLFGSHELNQREFFGRGFQRSRSPSPHYQSNPISWNPCPPCSASPTPQAKRGVPRMSMHCTQLANGPYAYSAPSSEPEAFCSAPSFLGSRKKRVAEPGPEPGVVTLLSPNMSTRGVRESRATSPSFQSPLMYMENEEKLRASRASQKARRTFPEKSATCAVKLGLQNGVPRKFAMPNDLAAFDSPSTDQIGDHGQRARFFSNTSASFVSRKKHFSAVPEHAESVASIMYQRDDDQDASSRNTRESCLNEHIAIARGNRQAFMSPHRVSQKAKVVEQGKPSKCGSFRSTTDLDFWKESKHMMKKMFHDDPVLTAQKNISAGLGMMEAPPSLKKSATTNNHMLERRAKTAREYSTASLTEILTNTLRQRQRAASHKLVWRP